MRPSISAVWTGTAGEGESFQENLINRTDKKKIVKKDNFIKNQNLTYISNIFIFLQRNEKKTTLGIISESQRAILYSISFEKDGTTEFEKFVLEFESNAQYNSDYQRIIAALQAILDNGALERFFRPEGKINDNVHAIPIDGGKLRLYCLRISEQIIILGNGGVKSTRSYQESPKLYGYVLDLQRFEKILKENMGKGYISVDEKELCGSDNIIFEI